MRWCPISIHYKFPLRDLVHDYHSVMCAPRDIRARPFKWGCVNKKTHTRFDRGHLPLKEDTKFLKIGQVSTLSQWPWKSLILLQLHLICYPTSVITSLIRSDYPISTTRSPPYACNYNPYKVRLPNQMLQQAPNQTWARLASTRSWLTCMIDLVIG